MNTTRDIVRLDEKQRAMLLRIVGQELFSAHGDQLSTRTVTIIQKDLEARIALRDTGKTMKERGRGFGLELKIAEHFLRLARETENNI